MRTATSWCKGHGRRERRTITTTTWLNEYLAGWPQLGQVFRIERERTVGGETTVEVVYGITSLGRDRATAEQLLGWSRAHWGIENGLHHTRDETFREDRCRVRRGDAARVLASVRNVALHLLKGLAFPSVAAATRAMVAHPAHALDLLRNAPSTSE